MMSQNTKIAPVTETTNHHINHLITNISGSDNNYISLIKRPHSNDLYHSFIFINLINQAMGY